MYIAKFFVVVVFFSFFFFIFETEFLCLLLIVMEFTHSVEEPVHEISDLPVSASQVLY